MIEVKSISKNFGNIRAVSNLSLSAKAGELITLLGPNAAGKSTLIRLVCGYFSADSGEVLFEGENISINLHKYHQNLGYMAESTPIYDEMNVLDYLQFVASIYKINQKNFHDSLSKVVKNLDIGSVLGQKIHTLSKGFRRRVGIASAIIHQPKILILDEPTEGLDPNQKVVLRNFLKDYAKNNLVLVSTHLLEEAESISSRGLVLNKGQLIADTTIDELKSSSKDKNLSEIFYNITNKEGGENVL